MTTRGSLLRVQYAPLHRRGQLNPEQAKNSRRQVDMPGRQRLHGAARRRNLRACHDQRHVYGALINRRVANSPHAGAARARPVIRDNHDERQLSSCCARSPSTMSQRR